MCPVGAGGESSFVGTALSKSRQPYHSASAKEVGSFSLFYLSLSLALSLLSLSPVLYLSSLSIHQSLSLSRSPSSSTLLEGFPSRVCCACLTPTWRKVASTSSPPLSSSGTVSPLNQQRGSDRYLDELTRKHRVYVNKCSGRSMEVKLFDHLGMYDRQSKRSTERQNDTSNNSKKKNIEHR